MMRKLNFEAEFCISALLLQEAASVFDECQAIEFKVTFKGFIWFLFLLGRRMCDTFSDGNWNFSNLHYNVQHKKIRKSPAVKLK